MYNTNFLNYYVLNIQVHMGSKMIISEKKEILKIFFYQSIELIELSRNPKEFFLNVLFYRNGSFDIVVFHFPDLI